MAIYDVRQSGEIWQVPGQTAPETREAFWRFIADRRLCPDRVQPEPQFLVRDGEVTADFTAFDRAAAYYFDVLAPTAQLHPRGCSTCFGWGHPPSDKFGEKPYEGEYPV
jgi:hypothetical protein